jgi:uncharacterized membrane protein YvlD (DUF360 family)
MKLFKGLTLLAFVAGALAGCGGTSNQTATLPTVESVALSPLVVGLAPGGTQALTVTATESTGATVTITSGVTYTSSNSSVATVSAAGVVTAGNSEGTANISATVTIGVNQTLTTTAPAVVTVTPVLDSISVAPAATTLAAGATQQLTVTGHFSGNNQMVLTGGVTFASSSTATATVDANGLVTAGTTAGTATITATDTASGLKATATITVAPTSPTLVSIALAPLTANVAQGGTVQLAVIGTYSDQSQAPLAASGESFTSMSPGVASVNAAGLVTVAANATVGATATIVASDTASGLTTSTANSTVITVTSGAPVTTGILSTGFNSNQTTTTSTSGTGVWSAYFGSSNSGVAGGSGGGYADQSVNPSYEYVYINDTVANLGAYTYQGVGIQPATGQTVSASGFNSLSFTLSVNAEWLSAGSPNFVVLIATKVTGVSNASCNPQVAAVVTATSSNPTAYTVPLSAFTKITQNCGVASVTAAQILAAPVTQIDFQADGLGAAITASGLTSNINTTVAKANSSPATYPTTINVQGTVSFVTATPPPAQLVSIALSPLTATIAAGGTQQLTVTGTYSDNTTTVLPASGETFTSMSPSVATVSAAGLVTVASGATAGATATITATDTASGISTTSATNSVITVATPTTPTTGVLSTGFNSNQTTTTSGTASGQWGTYFGSSDPSIAGGSGGGYADQNTNPSYEYVYINDTVANLGTYTYQGVDIQPATGQTVSSSGFNSLSFTLAVNAEWLSAGSPNFVVLIASNVAGVSSASCNPQVAAVVTATSSNPTVYTVPLTAFTKITQNCGVNTVTIAQILAAPVTQIDFQADGLGAAITASGLTSNINTTVAKAGSSPATYPTTINVQGTVSFVTANTTPPATIAVLSTGFNSNQTTTTSTAATGQWGTYFGSSDPTIAGGSGGGYADQNINPSYEYVYINDTVANLGTYTYQGVDIQPAATQTVGAGTNQHFSFTLAVNAEWLSAGSPNFVVLIASNVAGVSSGSCNPQVAAVVTATSSNPTVYTVPLTAFTKVTQNCGVATVTAAQVLAAPVTQIDFQADGLGAAITASGLTSNINTTVPKAASSPATYPTTINVQGTVGFVP